MVNVRLKSMMLEKGLSGFQLARAIGVSDSQFSRIVRGWIDPSMEIKGKLAGLLDSSVDQIFPEDQQRKDSYEYTL
jgi:transcriptional regulator with XRE-family HTH domain